MGEALSGARFVKRQKPEKTRRGGTRRSNGYFLIAIQFHFNGATHNHPINLNVISVNR